MTTSTWSESPSASHGLAFDGGLHESQFGIPASSVAVQARTVAGSPEFFTQKLWFAGLARPSTHSK